ncbi:MAG: hypothetical protein AAFY02_13220 [Pseudomonadota bacterium]
MLVVCCGFSKTPISFVYQMVFQMLEAAGHEQFELRNDILTKIPGVSNSAHLSLTVETLAALAETLPPDCHAVVKTNDSLLPFVQQPKIADWLKVIALDRKPAHAAQSLVTQAVYQRDAGRAAAMNKNAVVTYERARKLIEADRTALLQDLRDPRMLALSYEDIVSDVRAVMARIASFIAIEMDSDLADRFECFMEAVIAREGSKSRELRAILSQAA